MSRLPRRSPGDRRGPDGVTAGTVAGLLREEGFSPQANAKTTPGSPERATCFVLSGAMRATGGLLLTRIVNTPAGQGRTAQ